MQRRPTFRFVSLALLLSVGASSLRAQVRPPVPAGRTDTTHFMPPLGTIDGVVSDSNLVPIRAAFVSIVGTSIRVGTGPNGRFRIVKVPAGQYLVVVKRVGYHPASGVIEVPASDTLRLSYTLTEVGATELQPVVVSGKAPSVRMKDFAERRKFGFGEFMDEAQIARHNAVYPTELFRQFKAVNVAPNRASS